MCISVWSSDVCSSDLLDSFEEYIKWREKNPSDDMMTELLNADFKDPSGTTRKLTRDEISAIVKVVAGAGNETTNRLIGWMGKTLSEHQIGRAPCRDRVCLYV